MPISLKRIRKASNTEWDRIWQSCDYATYFHSREWAEVWEKYTTGIIKPTPQIVEFNDGKQALLPLSCKTNLRGLSKKYISSPAWTFGGWISTENLDKQHGRILLDLLCNKIGTISWRLNPYNPLFNELKLPETQKDQTHALDLTDDFESIYKLWSKGHKSAARKAQKAGVTADIAKSHESWKDYYSIYQDSLRRWGTSATSSYGWFLFKILYDQRSINIQLWLAKFEDKSIAGALCFYHRNHVAYWHGASLSDYSQLRPTNLLMYEIIRDSCRRKAKWFDFNPSGGHDGVKAFKKSFGATSFRADLFQSQKKSRPLIQKLANYFRRKN